MSAQEINIITIAFPDPINTPESSGVYADLDPTISFQYPITHSIRTLSTNGNNDDPTRGLLYVPDLSTDACKNASMGIVPQNVTRRENLPPDYNLIAFAPWTTSTCVKEYLDSTLQPHQPVKGFIFYLPGNTTDTPPVPNDPVWGLNDGGAWKRSHPYPVWAIAGTPGSIVMQYLALYSGNVTQVPNGHDLAGLYSPSEYIRLYTLIDLDIQNPLPSLWVFLLITLGLLVLIIAITSLIMHILQRRRRQALRERVINGEVDLEALGIKRLTVPREILDKMPVYKYRPNAVPSVEPMKEFFTGAEPDVPSEDRTLPIQPAFSQPTCAICLDDFEPNETDVRELPCRHIFHPECVDTFLLNNSSLCPMCKHSTLPRGHCPAVITNAMVRRERMAQRRRERAANIGEHAEQGPSPNDDLSTGPSAAMQRAWTGGRRIFTVPATFRRNRAPTPSNAQPPSGDIEMGTAQSLGVHPAEPILSIPQTFVVDAAACPPPSPSGLSRREWTRARALHLLGNRRTVEDEEEEQRQRRGPVRKIINRLFPG